MFDLHPESEKQDLPELATVEGVDRDGRVYPYVFGLPFPSQPPPQPPAESGFYPARACLGGGIVEAGGEGPESARFV